LRHPLWWSALVVLIVNDRLLKGGAIVPSWLTGKLSDFAFLIVAPVLVAVLLPKPWPARRGFAVASVGALFAASELSPTFAQALVAAAMRIGFEVRTWPDLTDLFALGVLPCAFFVLRERTVGTQSRVWSLARYERAGVVLGALACLATSAPPRHTHHPFFVNRLPMPVELRVSWVLRQVDCSSSPEALSATLAAADIAAPLSFRLEPGDVVLLAGMAPEAVPSVGDCGLETPFATAASGCVAAVLQTDSAQPVLMLASGTWVVNDDGGPFFLGSCASESAVSKCQRKFALSEDPGPDAVSLVVRSSGVSFDGARPGTNKKQPSVRIADVDLGAVVDRVESALGCRELREEFDVLSQSNACASDSDCAPLGAIPIPGEPLSCDRFANTASAARIHEISTLWLQRCTSQYYACAGASRPVTCTRGTCRTMCPERVLHTLPLCLERCPDDRGALTTFCERAGNTCQDRSGETCVCRNRTLACERATSVPQECEGVCQSIGSTDAGSGGRAGGQTGVAGEP
jgi:hypothetical protein